MAKKKERYLVSDAGFLRYTRANHGPFDQTVPGRIFDWRAGPDPCTGLPGSAYVNDRDYTVYSSLDYDESGIDISGSNLNDWPLRFVDGKPTFVPDALERKNYRPAFLSDEDLFFTFKDTDVRADPLFSDCDGRSIPIGLEIHCRVYSWRSHGLQDVTLWQFDIVNASESVLDSCYIVFGSGIFHSGATGPSLSTHTAVYSNVANRTLAYTEPTLPSEWPIWWHATKRPPTLGFPLLQTPRGYGENPAPLHYAASWDTIYAYRDSNGVLHLLSDETYDSIAYRTIVSPEIPPTSPTHRPPAVIVVGPFPMSPRETIMTTFGIIFSDSLPHLLLLDDYIRRVYNNNFQRPSPPPTPKLTARGLNRAVKLSWDNTAESATDIIIPDSLGRPFVGYRLLRAVTANGPFAEIGRWHRDTLLVHEFLDRGEDLPGGQAGIGIPTGSGGLKNNVRYYYRLLSFDEGAPRLKLDPMESPAVDRVNAIVAIPAAEPPDADGQEVTDEMMNAIRVVPNPYLIRHEAEPGMIFFNYLPEECTIRIYTVSLDLVKTIHHSGGSREEWDLTTEGGQLVASQMLIAHIEAKNGKSVTKKFSVVVGK